MISRALKSADSPSFVAIILGTELDQTSYPEYAKTIQGTGLRISLTPFNSRVSFGNRIVSITLSYIVPTQRYCWRKLGQVLKEKYIERSVKHGGGGIMIWGCITSYGIGVLQRCTEAVNTAVYQASVFSKV